MPTKEATETKCILANLNYIHQNVTKLTKTIEEMNEKLIWAQPNCDSESVETQGIVGFSEYLVNKLLDCNRNLEGVNKLI